METTTGSTDFAIPAIELSGRGEVSPLSLGKVIVVFGRKFTYEAPTKPAVPANRPLIIPATTAVFTLERLAVGDLAGAELELSLLE